MACKDIIGIWGYGKVGRSLATYFAQQGYRIAVMDKAESARNSLKVQIPSALFFLEDALFSFFDVVSFLYVSPGVDIINHYHLIKHKLKTETDLFFSEWKNPIIALTGTVGKTTIVSFLSKLLASYQLSVATGGNIGTPLVNLLNEQKSYALLELSSFQLEYAELICPTIAIWTNFHPNHLDRHRTEENYFLAKYKLLLCQTNEHYAIVPTSLIPFFDTYGWPKSQLTFTADESHYSAQVDPSLSLYSITNNMIGIKKNNIYIPLIDLTTLPQSTIPANWMTIVAILNQMNLFDKNFVTHAQHLFPLAHRTEYVTTIRDITFINDSKATTVASTCAAIEKYKTSLITLIIGGLSKGVDRAPFIKSMQYKVHRIVAFGAEAAHLVHLCEIHKITAYACNTVENAVEQSFSITPAHGIVLFSPAGSSYDLFENYEARGDYFKKTVFALKDRYENP